jgi:hypothetical protein
MTKCSRCGGSTIEIEHFNLTGERVANGYKCISCGTENGAQKKEGKMEGQPVCKHHPEVPERVGKNGRSLGLCNQCIIDRAKKANRSRRKLIKAGRATGRSPLHPKKALVRIERDLP